MPPTSPQLSIIIVSYNTRDLLADCLNSLRRVEGETAFEIIVVDNASSDGSPDMVGRDFPLVRLIRSDENLGFAGANNLGIEQAKGEFLFFLNPDTLVPRETISKLLLFINEHPRAAVVGAGLTYLNGSAQASDFHEPTLFREFWNFLPEVKSAILSIFRLVKRIVFDGLSRRTLQPSDARTVDCVSGAAFLARTVVIRHVEGFDSEFFLYHEEADLCARLREEEWEIWTLPEAQVIHHDAQASGYKSNRFPDTPILFWRIEGMNRFWKKHKSRFQYRMWRLQARRLIKLRILVLLVVSRLAWKYRRRLLRARVLDLLKVYNGLKTVRL